MFCRVVRLSPHRVALRNPSPVVTLLKSESPADASACRAAVATCIEEAIEHSVQSIERGVVMESVHDHEGWLWKQALSGKNSWKR